MNFAGYMASVILRFWGKTFFNRCTNMYDKKLLVKTITWRVVSLSVFIRKSLS